VPFSLERLETTGAPFLVVPGGTGPSLADDGTLCFVRPDEAPVDLVRVSRGGIVETVAGLAGVTTTMLAPMASGVGYRPSAALTVSPDGTRIAINAGVSPGQVWVHDVGRGSYTSVAGGTFPSRPIWSPRSDRLIYASARESRAWNLWSRRADAAGNEDRLSTSEEVQIPLAVSPDGSWLVYSEGSGPPGNLMKMSLRAPAQKGPLFESRIWGGSASFSPDGRWLAYESFESGRLEVYARPFPEGDQRVQVSAGGGSDPVWSKSGEIFYLVEAAIWSVSVSSTAGSLTVSKPAMLFRTGGDTHLAPVFDVTPDGQRFLMLRSRGGGQHISLILNWPGELARRAER
jgi:hypothetical protein